MIKRIWLIVVLFLCVTFGFSQPYGNEWIQYNQSYFKIYVSQDGIYRIPYNTLINALINEGLPTALDPRSIQIFHKGQEQYIYVAGENDGMFQSSDYIEFYGEHNDGWLDTALYKGFDAQANPAYSLFNDSSAYFVTWNSSINNRRMTVENDVAFSGYTAETFFYKIVRENYTSDYYLGNNLAGGITDPDYTAGEGWFDAAFSLGGSTPKTLNTPYRYTTGPDALVQFTVVGASNYALLPPPDDHLNVTFAGQTIDTTYEGYGIFRFNKYVPAAQINNTTNFLFSSINDLGSNADRNAIAFIQIKYPHTTNLEMNASFRLNLPDALMPKAYWNMTGLNASAGDSVRCYDLTNHKRIRTLWDGTNLRMLVPNSGGEKQCFITTDNQARIVNSFASVGSGAKFKDYKTLANAAKADYYLLTHASLLSQAQLYGTYRNTTGYSSLVINVDELWDQYAYGILKNPLAIRNFMRAAWYTFDEQPKELFIVGKGYRAGHDGSIPSYRKNASYFNQTMVPSYGNPPSDLLFTTGILDTMYTPAVPTGRLAARNLSHVALYLDKVIQYETAQLTPQEWMKNVLHFGGGTSLSQQQTLAGYLNAFKEIIEDTLFGGYVRTFLKTTTDPIQDNQSDSLKAIINNGVTLMTFFGHAAGIGFDQSIDYPSEYNNYGKYPFIIANSCYAGDIFLDATVSSEEFVLIEDKGTIGYLASIALGIADRLSIYSGELYRNISYKNYGKSIGECIQQSISEIQTSDLVMKETCLEMCLHGDPAIVLNSFEKPDYMITPANVYFTPANVSTETDTFTINVISTNIGRAITDSFFVKVVRRLPDGTVLPDYLAQIKATLYKDTIAFKMPVDLVNGVGLNTFDITLDSYGAIDEMSETNNSTQVTLLIKSAAIIPVWPYEYAVIPELPVTLKASTGYAFAAPQTYIFQLDTSDAFTSPILQETIISQGGGVVTWTPNFPILTDSIVYFWRVSPDSTASLGYNWRESSFQYIDGKRGWGQAHFHQFKNDNYEYVTYNKSARIFEFVNNILSVDVQTGYWPNIAKYEEWYKLNGAIKYIWAYLGEGGNGMIVADLDPISGQPRLNTSNNEYAWEFSCIDTNDMNSLATFIDNIPTDHYVLAYSHRNHNAENWTNHLYQAFESFGANTCTALLNNRPYIAFGKKGYTPGLANEIMGSSVSDILKMEDSIITKWTTGYMLSERIGPASSWGSLHWREHSAEGLNTDSVRLSVIGFNVAGLSDTLIQNLPPDSADIFNLSQRIDAAQWPYLRLCAQMKDDAQHTPAQMIRWQVLYEGAPETALNPSLYYYLHNDTLDEGAILHFAVATQNISDYAMDSLLIKYWVVDKDRVTIPLGSFRHRTHPAGDVLIDSISFSTKDYAGLNSLWVEINPDNDQPEQYHFNNIGEVYFYVGRDRANPMLDVTFDGVHIMNEDIVSARPEIVMMVKDENKYLALDDTSDYKVWIVPPESNTQKRVYFGNQDTLQFVAASLPENRAHLRYRPNFTQDGIYTLLVRAKDKSGNESGDADYEISFEVINKPGITAVMNWPNPFTTATHFVFTLTGSEVPSFFMIQIMTVTGKVVKEIRMDELGSIHVGRNITDYAWDGTDMYGDRLANGVYLYRVITRLNDFEIEKINTDADQYFKHEFGKMYLMR